MKREQRVFAPDRPGARRGRLSTRDVVCLLAVVVVVVVVSLPRLRDFAVRENESDAIRYARELADLCETVAFDELSIQGLLTAAARPELLRDAEFLRSGSLLRRRGYLFDLSRAAEEGFVVRAWPWEHGATGLGAFVVLPAGETFGHANSGEKWSGPERPPALAGFVSAAAGANWRRLP